MHSKVCIILLPETIYIAIQASLTRHEAGLLETMNSMYQAFGTLDGREKKKIKTNVNLNLICFVFFFT